MSIKVTEAQAYLAAIVNSSDDAIISKDLRGNITSWNPSAERIFEYSAEEAIGKHISMLIPPEFLSEEDYILGKIKQGERIDHFNATRRSKSGRLISVLITVSPIRDENGVVIGASKVARDITLLKEAERATAYLGAIIDSSDDAIISKDLRGFVTSWNKSAERIFGYTSDEMVGRPITMIIPPEKVAEEEKILTTLKTGDRIDHYETMRRHKSGKLVPISLTVSPIRDTNGNIIGASKVARYIGDRLHAELALRDMAAKKDEFLTNMSHELRTPMNAVVGLANLLSMLDLPEKARLYVKTLKVSADNMMDLINDLLDFAKIEADSIEIEQVEFNLAEQIEKAVSVASVKAQEKGLLLRINYPAPLNRFYMGDPLRVHQVLMNLLSNAIKFTEKGSIEVDIKGEALPSTNATAITMRVRDTGIGIPQDKLESIFEKFTQADSSTTRNYGGTGLGLAIVKALVQKMNGAIHVSSQLGIGTTFTVTFTFTNTHKISAVDTSAPAIIPAKEAPSPHKNVLLVEDYEPNIIVAEAILSNSNFNYDIAKTGLEAMRKFTEGKYDLILMDVQMRELDGMEATRRIRKMEQEKGLTRTPIIAMTAHARQQDRDECEAAGMDGYIPKPFSPKELTAKISEYVNAASDKKTGHSPALSIVGKNT